MLVKQNWLKPFSNSLGLRNLRIYLKQICKLKKIQRITYLMWLMRLGRAVCIRRRTKTGNNTSFPAFLSSSATFWIKSMTICIAFIKIVNLSFGALKFSSRRSSDLARCKEGDITNGRSKCLSYCKRWRTDNKKRNYIDPTKEVNLLGEMSTHATFISKRCSKN